MSGPEASVANSPNTWGIKNANQTIFSRKQTPKTDHVMRSIIMISKCDKDIIRKENYSISFSWT